tara:strand:- start:173 stop:511 length:339 start_codon:yes stop_codon:yes gene_type:complete
MTPDQRLKLAQALITEAVACSNRNEIEEAKHLTRLAVQHEFKNEIEGLILGDVELFKTTFKAMYSKNLKERIVSRVILEMLLENQDFLETFRWKYTDVSYELFKFEKEQEGE